LKKINDKKKEVNQVYEDKKQMFIVTMNVNDHTTFD
jgi:hypothetical protein